MIEGQREYGMGFLERLQRNNALDHGHAWDLTCIMRGDTGTRNNGTDYYQNLMFWAVPATVLQTDLAGLCAPGAFVDSIIRAGAGRAEGQRSNTSTAAVNSVPLIDTGA
jgi:hypothetical protein